MTKQLTTRQRSIQRLELLRSSLPYQGGDWKDSVAQFCYALPRHEDLPGISEEEYRALSAGDACPRWASEVMGDLLEELEGIVYHPDISDLKYAIEETKKLLKALELMLLSGEKPVDAYYTTDAMCILDKSIVKVEESQCDSDLSYEGDGSVTEKKRRLTIKLEIDIR